MTDAIVLPLTDEIELVIAADNSGPIGEKEADIVQTSNQTVGQFSCRVAIMEAFAAYAKPKTVVMQNFTNDTAWFDYEAGVRKVLREAGVAELPITGSTESNFPGLQSALGLTIIGTRKKRKPYEWTGEEAFAVIGTPYVGEEVLKNLAIIPSVGLFKEFTETEGVVGVLPIGSKGIEHAYERWTGRKDKLITSLNLEKTAGPATCFLIAYQEEQLQEVQQLGGELFYPLEIRRENGLR